MSLCIQVQNCRVPDEQGECDKRQESEYFFPEPVIISVRNGGTDTHSHRDRYPADNDRRAYVRHCSDKLFQDAYFFIDASALQMPAPRVAMNRKMKQ